MSGHSQRNFRFSDFVGYNSKAGKGAAPARPEKPAARPAAKKASAPPPRAAGAAKK